MNWITSEDIKGEIETKHQALEKSIHHWLQLSTASLEDFEQIIQGCGHIPMDGEECGLCEYYLTSEITCRKCPLVGDGCCSEYQAVLKHRNNFRKNITYKNKRKFQHAAKKLLIRLLQIKYREGFYEKTTKTKKS